MTEATNRTTPADYAFDGRVDAKKFPNRIIEGGENMKGAAYENQCKEPFTKEFKPRIGVLVLTNWQTKALPRSSSSTARNGGSIREDSM